MSAAYSLRSYETVLRSAEEPSPLIESKGTNVLRSDGSVITPKTLYSELNEAPVEKVTIVDAKELHCISGVAAHEVQELCLRYRIFDPR
jgi:hypothetical protein